MYVLQIDYFLIIIRTFDYELLQYMYGYVFFFQNYFAHKVKKICIKQKRCLVKEKKGIFSQIGKMKYNDISDMSR